MHEVWDWGSAAENEVETKRKPREGRRGRRCRVSSRMSRKVQRQRGNEVEGDGGMIARAEMR